MGVPGHPHKQIQIQAFYKLGIVFEFAYGGARADPVPNVWVCGCGIPNARHLAVRSTEGMAGGDGAPAAAGSGQRRAVAD